MLFFVVNVILNFILNAKIWYLKILSAFNFKVIFFSGCYIFKVIYCTFNTRLLYSKIFIEKKNTNNVFKCSRKFGFSYKYFNFRLHNIWNILVYIIRLFKTNIDNSLNSYKEKIK